MMTRILSLLILCTAFSLQSAEYIRGTLTITNSTTTNDAFTVNGSTRRGAGTRTATTWVTNASPMETATNIYIHIGGNKPSGVLVTLADSNIITLEGISLTLTASNFATLVLETNSTSVTPWTLMLPPAAFPASVNASNASALATLLASATNQLASNATILAHFVSLMGTQALANKTLTAPTVNSGYLTNSRVDASWLTNVTHKGNVFMDSLTNVSLRSSRLVFESATVFTNADTGGYWLFDGSDYSVARLGDLTDLSDSIDILLAVKATATNGALSGMNVYGSNYWHGNIIYTSRNYSSAIAGDNTDIPIGTNAVLVISGDNGVRNFHSFEEGYEGQLLQVIFDDMTGTNWIINNSGTEGTATRRILTATGGNVMLTNTPSEAWMRYRSGRWYLGPRTN